MIKSSHILGLIPARGGSKGIPHKNIKLLADKPLIAYTIETALKSRYIDHLVISTDSEEIATMAREYGGDVPFLRPSAFATDKSRAIDVIIHALHFMEDLDKKKYDLVVYLEPTTPNRTTEDIDRALELFGETDADSLASVVDADQYHPVLMKRIENNLLRPFCIEEPEGMPRQLYEPKAYMRNGAVYIFRRSNVLNRIMWGKNICPYIMPLDRSTCIDDMNDWYLAELWMKKLKNKQ
jgi:CMP-N,N'-diacetyllegionaminic acid synthase